MDANATELLPVEIGEELRHLLAAHPLPETLTDADMNQDEVAAAFSKSVNTIAKWTKAGMPFVQEGGPGRSYVYRLSHCWAWYRDRQTQEQAQARHNAAQVAKMQAHFLNIDLDQQPNAALDPKVRREMAQADLVWSQAARTRRSLVPLEEVQDLCEDLLSAAREAWDGLSDRLERELGLMPTQAEAVQRAARDSMDVMRQRIIDANLKDDDAGGVDASTLN